MATLFELWLVGEDAEHLASVGEAALDAVDSAERLLSRYDHAAEICRLNRDAAREPVLVDVELFAVLADCLNWFERTGGLFDVSATRTLPESSPGVKTLKLDEAIQLDARTRSVRFKGPHVTLDLGGYGKGYALDQAAIVLEEFRVSSALLHGGTSSVLARGRRPDGEPWRVGIRDPFANDPTAEIEQVCLHDRSLSSSATFGATGGESDLMHPPTRSPIGEQAACSVVAPAAVEAEVLSTALVAMGREQATVFWDRYRAESATSVAAYWIEKQDDRVIGTWLGDPPHEQE